MPAILKILSALHESIHKKNVETAFNYLSSYQIQEEYYLFYFVSKGKPWSKGTFIGKYIWYRDKELSDN